jgi:predicted Zn finger-like uncharacterized protein
MSMVTRCPGCNTLFRVTPQQLQARKGKVRCGRCMLVFDGFKMLTAMPEQAAERQGEAQDVISASAPPLQPAVSKAAASDVAEPSDVQTATPVAPEQAVAASTATQMPDGAAPVALPATAQPVIAPGPHMPDEEWLAEPARGVPPRDRWLWGAGSALLLLVAAAQAAYFYRTQLAADYPGLKPVLAQICGALGCSVPLPQRHHLLKVEASDLQVIDPARPAVIQLTVTLRNPAAYDLAFPALDLVLTNTQEHTLARRIFLPREYLEPGKEAGAGIPANAEITVSLDLDTGNLGASGFRLYLLPGPAG